ncbi:16S rRNA (cytosine(967)-C(5))-methyltransferase RsmB [Dokdonella sp.]|uniref:16S rRNA (cytosine(967)-C(5))-methyltransferase RsmB n=1 Tax=Dokdonella sp. TaxID=2291710 RepID=UPI0025BCDCAD|nr:16S rRNA (cytosine(967)-C(5))-methyltransferase RsmB [Dokdonella sp.]MBX3689133.1 16S rRNA (cytosine(967)-C(5))-methyltransferase RsmB [Dokdonella sp.]
MKRAAPRQRHAAPPAAGVAVRVAATRVLGEVAFDGVSLRAALPPAQAKFADPRDRALLAASVFAATRWWLRLTAALDLLMDKPLPQRARSVRALLVLGCAQIGVLGQPDYAVVGACVDATRSLGQAPFAGLVNAVLRRYARERGVLEAQLDADAVTRSAHPHWLIEAITRDWPQQAEAILAANNLEAPLTLRVNRRRAQRDELLAQLAAAGIEANAPAQLPDAIVLAESRDVSQLPGFAQGAFSVQDGAAQCVADLLDARDGLRVLDACAAPGGKAAHLLERARVDLVALDHDARRLARVGENLARLGLAAKLVHGDASAPAAWWDGRAFERILVDAPCSASGIIRRQPDIKLHRRAGDIAALAATQRGILDALWPLLAPGGHLLYATCSILREENEQVLAAFLAGHDDARAVPLPVRLGQVAGVGRQRLPGEGGMDGFFYGLLEKTG